MSIFEFCFILYFLKLSACRGFLFCKRSEVVMILGPEKNWRSHGREINGHSTEQYNYKELGLRVGIRYFLSCRKEIICAVEKAHVWENAKTF